MAWPSPLPFCPHLVTSESPERWRQVDASHLMEARSNPRYRWVTLDCYFRFFSRTTGVKPGDWVHVACSWFHDIAPARELGIHRVWLDRDQTGEDPLAASVRVTSASEVPAAITQLYP